MCIAAFSIMSKTGKKKPKCSSTNEGINPWHDIHTMGYYTNTRYELSTQLILLSGRSHLY
jgi:hypothetical protein